MVLEYDGKIPTIDETAFIHDMAFVSGEVYIGKDVFILPFASIRGDMNAIYIGEGSNIQDNAVVHVTDTLSTKIGDYVTVDMGLFFMAAVWETMCSLVWVLLCLMEHK